MPSKWLQNYKNRQYEDHKKRIKEAKCTIDLGKPPEMPMSMRREIERRRIQNAIEKDNRLLLDRLAIAMSKKSIDNELKAKPFTSYIELQRKRELQKICMENRDLLGRIQNTVPSYKHIEWERDAEKRVEYLRNMTEFPDQFVAPITKFSQSRVGSQSKLHRLKSPNSPTRSLTASEVLEGGGKSTVIVPSPNPLPPPGFMNDPMIQSELQMMESYAQQIQQYGDMAANNGQYGYATQQSIMRRNNTLPPLDR